MESLLKEFNDFIARRNFDEVSAYYEIVRFHSKFVDSNTK